MASKAIVGEKEMCIRDRGQTGLSIAFDLPTQTGYDPDAPEAAGEVGKVGVPVAHLSLIHI